MRSLFHSIEARWFASVRDSLLARGRDVSSVFDALPTLVVAPHPDDETLGCACTIARKVRAGAPVHVALVTDGSASHDSDRLQPEQLVDLREGEALEACSRLGVPASHVHFLRVPDTTVAEHTHVVARRLESLARAHAVRHILSPSHIDAHVDHRALGLVAASLVASGTLDARFDEYPVWLWTGSAWTNRRGRFARLAGALRARLQARRLAPLLIPTDGLLDLKRHALAAHRSQLERPADEPTWRTLEPDFLVHFFQSHEIFFALTPSLARDRLSRQANHLP